MSTAARARPRPRPRPPRARRPAARPRRPLAAPPSPRDPASRPPPRALGRRAGAVTAISSADAEIPEPEARDDAATDAAAAESNLNDLQAQLAALMSSNQALQQDLEKARPPEPEPPRSRGGPPRRPSRSAPPPPPRR